MIKPQACDSCSYASIGGGFVRPDAVTERTRLLVAGEAPGADEEREGRGFVGRSGNLLKGILQRIGLEPWEDVARTNVVLCHPPGNKFPGREIAWECLNRHQPCFRDGGQPSAPTLSCGANATEALTGYRLSATKTRGSVLPARNGGWLVATVHPAYIVRGPTESGKGKAQDWLYPLLMMDAKLAVECKGPWFPDVRSADPDEVRTAFEKDKPKMFAVDLESREGKVALVGVSWIVGVAWVMDWSEECKELLGEMLERAIPVAHNAAFDIPEMATAGVSVEEDLEWFDTINLAAAVDPTARMGLESQVLSYVPGSVTWKGLVDHRAGWLNETPQTRQYRALWSEVLTRKGIAPPKSAWAWFRFYNGLDVGYGLVLALRQREVLQRQGRLSLYTETMQPLQKLLLEMGDRGLRVDPARLRHHRRACDRLVRMANGILSREAGEMLREQSAQNGTMNLFGDAPEFNPNSHAQKTELLHDWLGLPLVTSKKVQGNTLDEAALESLWSRVVRGTVKPKRGEPEQVAAILRSLIAIPKWTKWRDTFLSEDVAERGSLYTQYTQHRNEAGRVSSGADEDENSRGKRLEFGNLQNFPRKIRDMVIPHMDGWAFVGADYAAIQWAIMMYKASLLPGSRGYHLDLLNRQQRNEFDPHTYLAAVAFQADEAAVTPQQRFYAKAFTFGRGFLGSARTLGRRQGIPDAISEKVCEAHEKAFRLAEWQRATIHEATKHDPKYTQTPGLWRRYFWGVQAKQTEVLASDIQGTEADLMKWALKRIYQELRRLPAGAVGSDWHLDTETHDSVLLDVPREEVPQAQVWLREMLESPVPWLGNRTWRVGVKTGKNWMEVS